MELDPAYVSSLDALPGVQSYEILAPSTGAGEPLGAARLALRTAAGDHELVIQRYRSHLSHQMADHIVAGARHSPRPLLVLAPHIGARLGAKLAAAGVHYLDAHGNCHISAPPLYLHIEGKTGAPEPRADKGLRSAGYQVLFAYLAEPGALDAPVRAVAELAGVSRQPVSDMKRRLLEGGYVFAAGGRTAWHPRGREEALGLWLHGYETTVRAALLRGRYRTREVQPDQLEERIAHAFYGDASAFRWGGSAAGARLTGHYRGERTVVHAHAPPADLPRQLRALADPAGNLVVLDAFGTLNWEPGRDTVHPLLVYSEMLHEGSERAREAAEELYEQHIAPLWAPRDEGSR